MSHCVFASERNNPHRDRRGEKTVVVCCERMSLCINILYTFLVNRSGADDFFAAGDLCTCPSSAHTTSTYAKQKMNKEYADCRLWCARINGRICADVAWHGKHHHREGGEVCLHMRRRRRRSDRHQVDSSLAIALPSSNRMRRSSHRHRLCECEFRLDRRGGQFYGVYGDEEMAYALKKV